nr:hypothetical protein [Tanacetum cinerariifolium]
NRERGHELSLRVKILKNSRAQALKDRFKRERPGEFHADSRIYMARPADKLKSGLKKLEEEMNK